MDRIDIFYAHRMGPTWHEAMGWPVPKGLLPSQHQVGRPSPPGRMASLDAKAHDLVSAMAGFAAPAIGQTTLADWYRPTIVPMLAVDGGS